MYCTKKITNDLTWVGGNNRRQGLFEGVYSIPNGVSYNSYLLDDEYSVLFDTVDSSISTLFFENLEATLNGKKLDFVVVQHMEPDHSATLNELINRYPDITIICNQKTIKMIKQFFEIDNDIISRTRIVNEGDCIPTGRHNLEFYMAPLVHWPEVMVTYDRTDKILFSADAFGCFGALNGAIYADEVDFLRDYMDESRRYYTNIVGKYGVQVQALLKKASSLDIKYICPLHGFVWRKDINIYLDKYEHWSTYTPEKTGVVIAYASVYGNTANCADVLSARLRDKGVETVMFDVSVIEDSYVIAAAFKYSHLVFASPTYNSGIFVSMDALLRDLAAHNLSNRVVAFIQNGTWAATSAKQMRTILEPLKNITFLDEVISIKSSLKSSDSELIDELVEKICSTI